MNKKDVSETFVENIQHDKTTDVTINGETYEIDNGIQEIVQKLNYEYEIRTLSSCSGILSEHFNMQKVEQKVSYEELKNVYGRPPRGYMLMKRPFLRTESFMHSFSEEKTEVDTDFYRQLMPSLSVSPPQHMKTDIEWKVNVGSNYTMDWQNIDERDITYRFELTLPSRRNIIMECESYDEHELAIKKALKGLEEAITAVQSD